MTPNLSAQAIFSECGHYRYFLRRDHSLMLNARPLLWCMLNPSKAGEVGNDPTTTLTMNLGKRWGFGIHAAVNAFALVGTDPRCLKTHPDPVGPENDAHIRLALNWCDDLGGHVILAWGRGAALHGRADAMLSMMAGRTVWRLGMNSDGSPRFPRAIAKTIEVEEWRI